MYLANYPQKVSHDSLARPDSYGIRCGLQTLGPAQTNDHVIALDLPSHQLFEGWKLALLPRVIRRQVANGCFVLFCAKYPGAVGLDIRSLAGQHKSAFARFNTLHAGDYMLEVLKNFAGVPKPSVAFAGLDYAAIRRSTQGE